MKHLSFSIFNVFSVVAVILIIILILLPFNLINLEQAERIAKWKSEYEKLKYSFSLVNMYEGKIIPNQGEADKIITDSYIWERFAPYFNLKDDSKPVSKRYSYRQMNGKPVRKNRQFYFENFYETKDGVFLSVKKNSSEIVCDSLPLYYMFVDINGSAKPNRIGQDIFFISIYRNTISALGSGRTHARLKADCSTIARGLYCSEYYLLGGSF